MTQLDMWENSPDRGNSWRKGPKERVFLTCSKEEASVAGGSTGRRGRQRGGGGRTDHVEPSVAFSVGRRELCSGLGRGVTGSDISAGMGCSAGGILQGRKRRSRDSR